jgi:hypothetical protein
LCMLFSLSVHCGMWAKGRSAARQRLLQLQPALTRLHERTCKAGYGASHSPLCARAGTWPGPAPGVLSQRAGPVRYAYRGKVGRCAAFA